MSSLKKHSMLKKVALGIALLAILYLILLASRLTSPVVVLHYSSAAKEPVTYFFNENNDIIKSHIKPGENIEFRTAHHPDADYYIDVSLPLASRDGVEIKPPFSRVDVYIDADNKISRTVTKTDFSARLGFD